MRWRSVCLVLALHGLGAAAEPYIPVEDAVVLERLPVAGAERRELRRARAELAAQPGGPGPALALARRYIALGRAEADPRYYGHAEAVLAPWLDRPDPPPEAWVLRATLLQNRHDFAAALRDLDAAVRRDPRSAQAWLTRAAILEVQGDYPAALRSCWALAGLDASLGAAVCLGSVSSLAGRGEAAYRQLRAAVADSGAEDRDELLWARTTLAEMAERLGHADEAEADYRAALGLGRRSPYLWAAYADFLLNHDRPAEVVGLLEDQVRADGLLLRLVLAEQRLGRPGFAGHAADLAARYAANQARGDASHLGEESRYALWIGHDPAAALRLAQANWSAQREPRDARALLEAAQAAGQPEAARPVLDFLARSGLQDVRLAPLVAALAGGAR